LVAVHAVQFRQQDFPGFNEIGLIRPIQPVDTENYRSRTGTTGNE
jgi:hypothetical protein